MLPNESEADQKMLQKCDINHYEGLHGAHKNIKKLKEQAHWTCKGGNTF